MKRITLFAGHYGSGKTNVALNWARHLKRLAAEREVVVADLDIVNPYFRTKDSAAELAADGIGLVVSDYANSNVDFPALPKEIYALTASGDGQGGRSAADAAPLVVMDIGGDDRGALALGRYVDAIRAENDYDMLAVVNSARPLTRIGADTVEVLREIKAACGLPFTGIVNNTNLGPDTTVADVLASEAYAEDVARQLGVALRFTAVREDLAAGVGAARPNWTVLPLVIQRLYYQLS